MNNIKITSLFSGCGGFDLGFHLVPKYKVIWANDFVKDFCDTFESNFNLKPIVGSIIDINPRSIPKADLLIGGPPCQSFSLVGKRNSSDQRGNLVWNYLDVLKFMKPKMFLFENVPGIKSAKNKNGTLVIRELETAFSKLGYKVEICTLNAADYGVPQKRKRVFIVGNLLGKLIGKPKPTHSKEGGNLLKWITAEEALGDLPAPSEKDGLQYRFKPKNKFQILMRKNSLGVFHHYPPYSSKKDLQIIKAVKPGGNYMDVPPKIATKRILSFQKTGGRTTTYGRLDSNQTPYTINTHFNRPNVGCNIHYSDDRLITIREALRIQSFPDSFTLQSSNKRNYYLQVGNAVPPLLAKAWAKHLKKIL